MSCRELSAEAGQFTTEAEIKATGSGLVFSVTEESDQSHTFLSEKGRQFIHVFVTEHLAIQQMLVEGLSV